MHNIILNLFHFTWSSVAFATDEVWPSDLTTFFEYTLVYSGLLSIDSWSCCLAAYVLSCLCLCDLTIGAVDVPFLSWLVRVSIGLCFCQLRCFFGAHTRVVQPLFVAPSNDQLFLPSRKCRRVFYKRELSEYLNPILLLAGYFYILISNCMLLPVFLFAACHCLPVSFYFGLKSCPMLVSPGCIAWWFIVQFNDVSVRCLGASDRFYRFLFFLYRKVFDAMYALAASLLWLNRHLSPYETDWRND